MNRKTVATLTFTLLAFGPMLVGFVYRLNFNYLLAIGCSEAGAEFTSFMFAAALTLAALIGLGVAWFEGGPA